jgi:hypothetical protein
MIRPSTSRLLLEEYKNSKNATKLVEHYHELITKIAKLARGVYGKQDAWYRWYYGLFLNGEVKSMDRLRAVADHITLAMHFVPYRDCYNQTVVFLLTIARRFKQLAKGGISFSKYIRMVLGWRMRNWANRYLRDVELTQAMAIGPYLFTDPYDSPDIQPFTMNIAWILYGTKGPLFRTLTAYDRYIIYLYFAEGTTIRDIAKITVQSKDTVNHHLQKIISTCRSNAVKEE